MRGTARFAVLPRGSIELSAEDGVLDHFRAEYGAPDAGLPVRVGISFDRRLADGAAVDLHGGHKTISWSVSLGPADGDPIRAAIALRGSPRWFGVSLVQGFVVEPLISVAAAMDGQALLPAAAIAEAGGALLIIGRSRSGKSSIAARALALGRPVLGDDQVLVAPDGAIGRFPRRIRVYDDLMQTSPVAFRALPRRARLGLRLRRLVRVATRGFVAPSLALPHSAFGAVPVVAPMPLHRVVVVRRTASAEQLTLEPMVAADVRSEAIQIIQQQRRSLSGLQRGDWLALLAAATEHEAAILDSALGKAPAQLVSVPEAWGARYAIDALASALEIG